MAVSLFGRKQRARVYGIVTMSTEKQTEIKKYDCQLCDLVFSRRIKTKVYFENDRIIIIECKTCKVPMAVLKFHMPEFEESDMALIYHWATDRTLFNGRTLDYHMKTCTEHAHVHFR